MPVDITTAYQWRITISRWGELSYEDLSPVEGIDNLLQTALRRGIKLDAILKLRYYDPDSKIWIAVSESDLQWAIADLAPTNGGDAA
jgi:hypothetical protein